MTVPASPGTPGSAVYISDLDHEVVGLTVNGILIDVHSPTWSYDKCNGHSDGKHQYHYHILPYCLSEQLGISTPDTFDYWVDFNVTCPNASSSTTTDTTTTSPECGSGNCSGGHRPCKQVASFEAMYDAFPATSSRSPVMGIALDGFPIYGPYDANGDLQHGSSHNASKLDECNGKTMNGQYAYYFTPDYPFSPKCLRGTIGTFNYTSTLLVCPAAGIPNTIGPGCADTPFRNLSSTGDCVPVDTTASGHNTTAESVDPTTIDSIGSTAAAVDGTTIKTRITTADLDLFVSNVTTATVTTGLFEMVGTDTASVGMAVGIVAVLSLLC